jgi:hypothetical protein
LLVAVPQFVAPTWLPITWPIGALILAYEIQAWISLPGRWNQTANASPERLASDAGAEQRAANESTETTTFLDRVDAALGLPAEVRSEIRAELADHLADSIEALEAEGLERTRATREALARLGRAEDLARRLRAAHQSTRRLLAGAAGGVWSAGVGLFQGYLAVFGLVALSLNIGLVLLARSVEPGVGFTAIKVGPSDLEATSALLCIMAWVPAFVAGRRCVRASARLSRRKVGQLRVFWAIAGIVALGWLLTFHLAVQQSWLVVPCELAVPVAFAAGALLRPDASLHLPRSRSKLVLIPAAILVGGLLMGAAVPDYADKTPATQGDLSDRALGYDRVAPAGTVPCDSPYEPVAGDGQCFILLGGATQSIDDFKGPWAGQYIADGLKNLPFTDMRIEVWRALAGVSAWDMSDTTAFAVDPASRAAFLTEPATIDGFLRIPADLGSHRQRRWLVFMTGVGTDSQRYRLGEPLWFGTPFTGTIWDWVTASD